jgi:hypothetical protein
LNISSQVSSISNRYKRFLHIFSFLYLSGRLLHVTRDSGVGRLVRSSTACGKRQRSGETCQVVYCMWQETAEWGLDCLLPHAVDDLTSLPTPLSLATCSRRHEESRHWFIRIISILFYLIIGFLYPELSFLLRYTSLSTPIFVKFRNSKKMYLKLFYFKSILS